MKLVRLVCLSAAAGLAGIATLAAPIQFDPAGGVTVKYAEARRGADDGPGHIRRSRGADDGPGHVRGRGDNDGKAKGKGKKKRHRGKGRGGR
jgi:hypothetical protein